MKIDQLREILLLEVHREIHGAAHRAVQKLGNPVPEAAIQGYVSPTEQAQLRNQATPDFDSPAFKKSMRADLERVSTLSYPPDGVISADDAAALESLKLSKAQAAVLERVVAEAVHSAFFHFFALLDSVADPSVTTVSNWKGASLVYPRKEGALLHDELGDAYYGYRAKTDA